MSADKSYTNNHSHAFIPQQEPTLSTALMLADLDDFLPITRQECIKPFLLNNNTHTNNNNNNTKKLGISELQPNPISDSRTTSSMNNNEGGVALVGVVGTSSSKSTNNNARRTNRLKFQQANNNNTLSETSEPKKIAKIELADCLACSGCVTTAESVLVNQQSVEQFLNTLREMNLFSPYFLHHESNNGGAVNNPSSSHLKIHSNGTDIGFAEMDSTTELKDALLDDILSSSSSFLKQRNKTNNTAKKQTMFFVTISQQSAASLASYYQCESVRDCLNRLSYLFKTKLGAIAVFESASLARMASHLEICEDFVRRYREGNSKIPLFASSCPGWICYAEKTHPEILPYISTVKSPQQIMGTFVKKFIKHHISAKYHIDDFNIYHTTVMPCFDKKLEASRPDFTNDPFDKVDMVLTSSEITELLKKQFQIDTPQDFHSLTHFDLNDLTLDNVFDVLQNSQSNNMLNETNFMENTNDMLDLSLLEWLSDGSDATGSGGYCEIVFKYAAKKLFNIDIRNTTLQFESKRNSDYREVVLYDPNTTDQKVLLKFVIANGFRNIQNLVRRMKQSTELSDAFHFVEVMACPIGCLNGGGQVKAKTPQLLSAQSSMNDETEAQPKHQDLSLTTTLTPKQHLSQTERLYREYLSHLKNLSQNDPQSKMYLSWLYNTWIQGAVGSPQAQKYLHTTYHAVEKMGMISASALKW
ncbi:hypothetical protein C9374_009826 [Naegleria lovaniensis]|uniref:Iron hydrogenase large subunit C-terminal domain-containing protein n=1 Tax=Naegleria lovaniensis TaxID=51637 RepID=A0AA88KS27_NAELO|nr:uncharacterized protein C9374_009826 [Naegleria lovaniensis]KAG2393249.1 hypothetical protein C9374_009826 [Naegleria lovaniensis]